MISGKVKIFASIFMCLAVLMQSGVVSAADKAEALTADGKLAGEYAEGEAVVILKDNAGVKYLDKSDAAEAYGDGITIKDSSVLEARDGSELKVAAIKAEDGTTKQLLTELRNNSAVKYVVPNYKRHTSSITNDAYSDFQWALDNKGQNGGRENCDTNADALWPAAKKASDDAIVAVLDTGIDYTHEDLKNNLWVNPYGSKLKGIYGYDFSGENNDRSPMDGDGHGTHVSGIIAAKADNSVGISGINKSGIKIMALKTLDNKGEGYFSDEIKAFNYIEDAYKLGANIKAVNCSYGGISDSQALKIYDRIFDTLGSYGIVSCVAAGNDGLNLNEIRSKNSASFQGINAYMLPAETNSEYVLTVGASNERDGIVGSSNTGDCVDIAAPGACILSTVSYNCFNPSVYSDTGIKSLCRYYQDYESDLTGFGVPEKYNNTIAEVEKDTDNCFNSSGGLSVDSASGDRNKRKIISFPYTISNTAQEYEISFMIRSSGSGAVYFDDCGSEFHPETDFEKVKTRGRALLCKSDAWTHVTLTNKTEQLNDTDRQLVFCAETDGAFAIDDLAVGNQGVDSGRFGKYDFESGTSMACSYVSGAAALIANARSEMTPEDIVLAIKETGRSSDALEGLIKTGKTLSLDKILDFEIPKRGRTGDCRWEYDKESNALTITGDGRMEDYKYGFDAERGVHNLSSPWKDFSSEIKEVIIGEGVTSIGDGSFAGCSHLVEVGLSSTVSKIGAYAFFDTAEMQSITMPNNISSIGRYAVGYRLEYWWNDSSWDEWHNLDDKFINSTGSYNSSSETGYTYVNARSPTGSGFAETPNETFVIYAYSGSKTAACLKAAGYRYNSLGGLTLSKYSASLYVKGTVKILSALKNMSAKKSYSSSNSKIAKVSSGGKVTAVKKGTAKITVKSGELRQTFMVTVKNPALNVSSKKLKIGRTFKLKIKGLIGKASFKSSDKKISAVSSKGVIKAKSKGKAFITVKANSVSLKCKVIVK